jgi:hypothetical protein
MYSQNQAVTAATQQEDYMDWRLFKPHSYQIRWLDTDAANALLTAGIPLDSTEDGIFILAEHLPAALAALNARVVNTFPSQFKRIDEVVLAHKYERHGQGTVSIESDANHESKPEYESILSLISGELLPFVQRDIVVHPSQGKSCAPVSDGRFHIFVDSAAEATATAEIPENVFGIPVQIKQSFFSRQAHVAYLPTERGKPIVDWSTGFTAAELIDNCLYLHFDVLNCKPVQMQRCLMLRILKKVADELRADEILAQVLQVLDPERVDGAPVTSNALCYREKRPRRFSQQTLCLIGRLLAPKVKVPVQVHVDLGLRAAVSDDKFHLFLPGSPANSPLVKPPERVFDLAVGANRKSFTVATGTTPVTDGTGFVAAQLVGMNNLYLSFNPLDDSAEGIGNLRGEWELLGRMLQAAMKELDVDSIIKEIVDEIQVPAVLLEKPADDNERGAFQVAVQGFSNRPLAVVSALSQQLLVPHLGMDISVSHAKGENRQPLNDGRFHVFFQASPAGELCATTPAALFGIGMPAREPAFWPSGAGIAIADDTGFLAAELVENNLYIHAEIIHAGTRNEARLLARLMVAVLQELALKAVGGSPKNRADAYQTHCLSRVKGRLENSHTVIDPETTRQADLALREAIAATRLSESDFLRLEANEQFGAEYDELLSIEKVKDVTVSKGQILVETNVLYCVDPRNGRTHEIGQFQIQIPTEGGRLHWFNRTRIVSISSSSGVRQMHAPHVGSDGLACEGTTKEEWPLFIRQRQFAYVIMKAIQFIESVNETDVWGKTINHWPVVAH